MAVMKKRFRAESRPRVVCVRIDRMGALRMENKKGRTRNVTSERRVEGLYRIRLGSVLLCCRNFTVFIALCLLVGV